MKRKSSLIVLVASLLVLSLVIAAAAETVKNNSKTPTYKKVEKGVANCIFSQNLLAYNKENEYSLQNTFNDDTKGIFVRAYLPKKVKELDFDILTAYLYLSSRTTFQQNFAWRDEPRENFDEEFMERDSIGFWIYNPETKNGDWQFSGDYVNRWHLWDYLSEQKMTKQEVKVVIMIYKKVKEEYETVWDDYGQKYITRAVPVYDKGKVISQGTAIIEVPKK